MHLLDGPAPCNTYTPARVAHPGFVEPTVSGRTGVGTGSCYRLQTPVLRKVTPGGQRTMRTCLGAAAELQDAAQLPAGWADGCAWLHCEGYCLHRPAVAIAAMRAAREAGAQVSGRPTWHLLAV